MDEEKPVDLGATHFLMGLPEDVRREYCISVIKALEESFEEITKIKGKIPQGRAMQSLMRDIKEKRDELLPVILYTLKPEFREVYLGLLERFSGYG